MICILISFCALILAVFSCFYKKLGMFSMMVSLCALVFVFVTMVLI